MKFKYLTIAFSIIIVFILLMAFLLPSLITAPGTDLRRSSPSAYAGFWHIFLFLFIFMALVLAGFAAFYILNYRLFSLLEREDWPALAFYLEQELFDKKRYSVRKVQLLASAYMVVSDYHSVLNLESKAILAKPVTVSKNALIFGAARVLNGNYKEAAAFYRKYMEKDGWARWYYGFSGLLSGLNSQAESEFTALAESSANNIITGLSAYFLDNNLIKSSLKPDECRSAAENGRSRVTKKIKNAAGWKKEVKKTASEIHIAIIRKYVEETGKWLFNQEV